MLGDAVTLIAGAALGGVAKNYLPGNETIKNAAVTGIGLFLPSFVKAGWAKGVAAGMVAYGGVSLVKQFADPSGKFIAGIDGDQMTVPMRVGEIEDNLSVISGGVMAGDQLSVLSGVYDEEEDY
jgi:hypothetical protein